MNEKGKAEKDWAYLFSDQDIGEKSGKDRIRNIWAVAGGKGGVGKSLLVANFGIFLARREENVVVADLDLGCPNLHTCLGLKGARKNVTDFLKNRVDSLEQAAVETGFDNLRLISGVKDNLTTANFTYTEKQKLLRNIDKLYADYVILDLSAGISYNTLDFFLLSTTGILVSVPEPTSVENLYRFVKALILRHFKSINDNKEIEKLLVIAEDEKNERNIKQPVDLLEEIDRLSPEKADEFARELRGFNLKLIMNQTRKENDIKLGSLMESVFKKHFGLNVEYVGHIDHDFSAWQSVQGNKTLLRDYPNSISAQCVEKIGRKLTLP